MEDSPHILTTFPVVFADEEEKGQVNQVISSLFSKVRSRFTAPATISDGATSRTPGRVGNAGGVKDGVGRGLDGFRRPESVRSNGPGLMPSPLRISTARISDDQATSTSSSPTVATHIQSLTRGRDATTESTSQSLRPPSTDGDRPTSRPAFSRAITLRDPAPAVLSTTPVVRSQDYAHMILGEGGNPRARRESNASITSNHQSSSFAPNHHIKNLSTSSSNGFSRVRRLSSSGLSTSPSSTNLSALALEQFDLSHIPGFSIADDARSIRTDDGLKRNGSVSKIIRRLRGEGLSKQYWMADENCKECYDCKSVFSTWRRKHHCRICGQIFCSRCAPNIIKGYRFGHDGMVRVCNLCLEIMAEVDDDEDDKRSVTSNTTSHLNTSALMVDEGSTYMRSPFAASQLFSRNADVLNPIQEGRFASEGGGSVPVTPIDGGGMLAEEDDPRGRAQRGDGPRHPLLDVARDSSRPPGDSAPFRRAIADEDKEVEGAGPTANAFTSRSVSDATMAALKSPSTPADTLGTISGPDQLREHGSQQSTIPFPPDSPALPRHENDGPTSPRVLEFPVTPPGALTGGRSRLSSRMSIVGYTGGPLFSDMTGPNSMWGSRSHLVSFDPDMLPAASMLYFRRMLRQAIDREGLPHAEEWERVLAALLMRVAAQVSPNVTAGDSMDVRNYVKIKKVPGGLISQSEYVDGLVITKNVAHKQMPRHMLNPRIMVLTFPLDYHRVENQFMSLDPLLAQERNYLRHLTRRVIDVRPHIVLVERSVSKLALDFLLEAKVAVARGVKPSSIEQIARLTQADVIASMDRLALEPKLGRCTELKIETYEHVKIPGFRKTYMRFEGCNDELGCSLILRGGDWETLQKVKRITKFMTLVAANLKVEVCLFYDEFNILPPDSSLKASEFWKTSLSPSTGAGFAPARRASANEALATNPSRLEQQREADRISEEIRKSLEPYVDIALSISCAVAYPPPGPLARMGLLDERLRNLKLAREEAEAALILQEEGLGTHVQDDPKTPSVESSLLALRLQSANSADGPLGASMTIETKDDPAQLATTTIAEVSDLSRVLKSAPSKKPVLHDLSEIQLESDISFTEFEHREQLKLWSWYRNRYIPDLRPEVFQNLHYLSSMVCEGSDKPCVGPDLLHMAFYSPEDRTLGQFLESLAASATRPCPSKTCARLQLYHFHVLVHGSTRLQIAVDQFPCPSPGNEDKIITWSYCKVCKIASPTAIIKEETWRMSWTKYLEHSFYPPASKNGFGCPHDIYRDQIRYFGLRHLAIRVHNEFVDVYDISRPPLSLHIKKKTHVSLKNQEYGVLFDKIGAFFDSVALRLRTFDIPMVAQDRLEDLKIALSTLGDRADEARKDLLDLLERTYRLSGLTDVLALNVVYRNMQDCVVQWDNDLGDLDKSFLPSEKDIRRMTANHLKRLFASQDMFGTMDRSVSGMTVSEADERGSVDADKERQVEEKLADTPAPTILVTDEKNDHGPTEAVMPSSLDIEPLSSDLGPPALTDLTISADTSQHAALTDDAQTPMVERPFPFAAHTPATQVHAAADDDERSYNSDSTISAHPKRSPKEEPALGVRDGAASAGLEEDSFISRLPRRSHPAPTVADLMKRFQKAPQEGETEARALSPGPSIGRQISKLGPLGSHGPRDSGSEEEGPTANQRPKFLRGRTEGSVPRGKQHSIAKMQVLSDSERSYAANASRIPFIPALRRFDSEGVSIAGQLASLRGSPAPSPAFGLRGQEGATSSVPSAVNAHAKRQRSEISRMGKGKRPARASALDSDHVSLGRRLGIRSGHGHGGSVLGSRVSDMARQFDALSKEAERDRQKRLVSQRNRRARPVAVTNAKVQVFSNFREAFRDESDEESTGADDENDEEEDLASVQEDEGDEPKSPPSGNIPLSNDLNDDAAPKALMEAIPIEIGQTALSDLPSPAFEPSSLPASEAASDLSFRDRLPITLPPFDTTTPLVSAPPTPMMSGTVGAPTPSHATHSHVSEGESSTGGQERSSILKTLSSLWAFRTGDYSPLEYPLAPTEHVFADSRIIVREDEPTSIISFILSSKSYRDKMRNVAHQQRTRKAESTSSLPDGGSDTARMPSADPIVFEEPLEPEDIARSGPGTHINYDFENGPTDFFCKIFFAERFAALRQACNCEDSYLDSLARCLKWDSSGGKSGSAFLKSRDDRFIAKEISRLEMDALMKFAPSYFEYMKQSLAHNRPTALAKIYGFYKIGYHNANNGKSMKMNMLIMENLFYERRFERIYDLKGSMRNRLVQVTGKENQVLLDENLVEVSNRQPLYLRDHSKKILQTALWNDTLFLSNLNVMDYSLVVGIDAESQEMVIGVVDYVRTFTWDKQLESWVKDLGGAGTRRGEPTIVTPKQYKTRFRAAMERYFPVVPDRWFQPSLAAGAAQVDEDTAKSL